ncbi:GNAT family N-acetyltransferase [Mycetocola tolaasinivorans]|uniref:GNAT family N-acetyltransferase n=1 Tax=Mycetocola tolaasinivorans TaxID=76635 RepID=A0A3L7A7N0_9MICO|nr:GNAT family N-acetyltransferase [Mycetocola tolaasinivorans]RLP76095.1 GNAT family N-acetyltransferase [Mycetocola tolaasinivorans]
MPSAVPELPIVPADTRALRRGARALLVRVFERDPMWRRLVRWAWARTLVLRYYYGRAVRVAHAEGRIDVVPDASGRLLAAAVWFIPSAGAEDTRTWHLEAVVVDENARGKSLGSRLLRHALEAIDAEGAAATLDASTPDSQRLYQRYDFHPIGPVPVQPWARDLKMRREPR